MTEHTAHAAGEQWLRISDAAREAGVSPRALRYYQELGLLTPAGATAGGARRYSMADLARVQRIGHLRDLVGLNLKEIGRVLAAEDRLAAIRREWFEAQSERRQVALLEEAVAINTEMQEIAEAKMTGLIDFVGGLRETVKVYDRKLREIRRGPNRDGGRSSLLTR